MAILSVLRPTITTMNNGGKWSMMIRAFTTSSARSSGHGNTMVVKPSEFQWRKFKDLLHLYLMIGFIPLFTFATYQNYVHGNARLAETPEGYTPHHWEYQRHPIQRLISWGCKEPLPPNLERKLEYLNKENEKIILKKIEAQVRNMMDVRSDYRAWAYQPMTAKFIRVMRDKHYKLVDLQGIKNLDGLENVRNDNGPDTGG